MTDDATKQAHEAVELPMDWIHLRHCDCFSCPADPPYNTDRACRELTDRVHAAIDAAVKAAEERGSELAIPLIEATVQGAWERAGADMRERAAKWIKHKTGEDELAEGVRALPLEREDDD